MGGKLLALTVALTLATGCAGLRAGPPVIEPPVPPPPAEPRATPEPSAVLDPGSPEILAAYATAIEDARYPAPEKISRDLTPLLRSTDGLIWDRQGRLLMATWTRTRYFADPEKFRRGEPFYLAVDTWLTAVPFVRDFCRALDVEGPKLNLRLEQRLGLPPNAGKDALLEIFVDPVDLFRPCPDPEISDHECQVEIPVVDRGEQRPWDCDDKRQVSSRYVTVHPDHLQWMCYNWMLSYGSDKPLDNYPWTALGYTYDWGNPDDPRGLSEYVSLQGSEVIFHSLTPTELYCSKLDDPD